MATDKTEQTVFQENDLILPHLQLPCPVKIKITLEQDCLTLVVGPRDWQWDRRTGKMVGCGTVIGKPQPVRKKQKAQTVKMQLLKRDSETAAMSSAQSADEKREQCPK